MAGGGVDAGDAAADRIGALLVDVRRRADALPDMIGRDSLALRLTEIIGTAASLVTDARGPGAKFVKPEMALRALELMRKTLVNAAELAAMDTGARDVLLREPIVRELAGLLNPPAGAGKGTAP